MSASSPVPEGVASPPPSSVPGALQRTAAPSPSAPGAARLSLAPAPASASAASSTPACASCWSPRCCCTKTRTPPPPTSTRKRPSPTGGPPRSCAPRCAGARGPHGSAGGRSPANSCWQAHPQPAHKTLKPWRRFSARCGSTRRTTRQCGLTKPTARRCWWSIPAAGLASPPTRRPARRSRT